MRSRREVLTTGDGLCCEVRVACSTATAYQSKCEKWRIHDDCPMWNIYGWGWTTWNSMIPLQSHLDGDFIVSTETYIHLIHHRIQSRFPSIAPIVAKKIIKKYHTSKKTSVKTIELCKGCATSMISNTTQNGCVSLLDSMAHADTSNCEWCKICHSIQSANELIQNLILLLESKWLNYGRLALLLVLHCRWCLPARH